MKKAILLASGFFAFLFVYGQKNLPGDIQELIENYPELLFDENDAEADIESRMDILNYYYNNPININKASREDLEKLWFLNDFQILSLIDYRKSMGKIVSLYELNYVFGFTAETVKLIFPFFYIGPSEQNDSIKISNIARESHYDWLMRTGYSTTSDHTKYLPVNLYSRFILRHKNNISLGIIAENDAGEPFFAMKNKTGFDYYSGHLLYKGKRWLNTLVVGDYRYRAGQGLLIWNGFGSYKSSQLESLEKRGQGLSGNTSKNEFNYLRGGGVSLTGRGLTLTLFGSSKKLDGSLDTLTTVTGIKNINETGYHRTSGELSNKNSIEEKLFGTSLGYKTLYSKFNINFIQTTYSLPFIGSDKIYQYKSFKGDHYSGFSADYKIMLKKLQLFGEIARGNETVAWLNGVNFMPVTNFYLTVLYRNYPEAYYSPYSNMLSNNSSLKNENGFFAGIKWHTNWNCIFTFYTDVYSYPWLSYNADGPSNGTEYLTLFEFFPGESFNFNFRYKYKSRETNHSINSQPTDQILPVERQNIRIGYSYEILPNVSTSGRLEWCQSGDKYQSYSSGYLLYTNFSFSLKRSYKIMFRYTFFNIDDYNSRIYVYENDILYGFSIPAYFSEGYKIHILLRKKINHYLTAWLRYEFQGSFEPDIINKHGFKCQIRIRI